MKRNENQMRIESELNKIQLHQLRQEDKMSEPINSSTDVNPSSNNEINVDELIEDAIREKIATTHLNGSSTERASQSLPQLDNVLSSNVINVNLNGGATAIMAMTIVIIAVAIIVIRIK